VMTMAQNNVLVHSEQLFARKGEAAPAGRTGPNLGHGSLSHFPQNAAKKKNAKKQQSSEDVSSSLSGLIQRRAPVPEEAAKAESTVVTEHEVYANWRKLKNRLETPGRPEPKEEWKKLTFRVRHDQFVRLKSLSGLWGTTYQSILEKAVAYYIDEATSSEGSDR